MAFLPQEIIRKKRDGKKLAAEDIHLFIKGLTAGQVSEAQAAAFAMAVFFSGMHAEEISELTHAMKVSGNVLYWQDMPGPVVDKHSTGGVGDKVSLMLAPICAACGCYVPMISGRGLGHTGGTLDKLNAIPGYNVHPEIESFQRHVRSIGCAIIGQTSDMAPADRILYAVRDVTATVESVPLITASILSKKLCAGLDALTMDIKVGNGAFMTSTDDARKLGNTIKATAEKQGVNTGYVITDMNEVLGSTAGNALEVTECLAFLRGNGEQRLTRVTFALCEHMLMLTGLCDNKVDAQNKIEAAVTSGKALEIFAKMVSAAGAPADFCENADRYLPKANVTQTITAQSDGYILSQNTRRIGLAVVGMGGGRTQTGDKIDYSVGFSDILPVGTKVNHGDILAVAHAQNQDSAAYAANEYAAAVRISPEPPTAKDCIIATE